MKIRSLDTGRFVAKVKDPDVALRAVRELQEYYLPTLKFSMRQARKFAFDYDSSVHHGMANAFETAIGCIEEAIEMAKEKDDE